MGTTTLIEWTDHTFNPWVGCTQISPGCANCYAKTDAPARIARSRRDNPLELWGDDGARQIAKDWSAPVAWNRKAREEGVRRRVFCLSQGDVFEDRADLVAPRARLWKLIAETPHLDWLLLTKRPENASRLASLAALHAWDGGGPDAPTWLPNIWLGATVENQKMADERIPHLLGVPAKVRFLSCEPLLEEVDLTCALFRCHAARDGECSWKHCPQIRDGEPERSGRSCPIRDWGDEEAPLSPRVDWVIIGGESGHKARPCDLTWIRGLVEQCKAGGVSPFVKQLGACASDPVNGLAGASLKVPKEALPLVSRRLTDKKGGDPSEWPEDLRIRDFPGSRRGDLMRRHATLEIRTDFLTSMSKSGIDHYRELCQKVFSDPTKTVLSDAEIVERLQAEERAGRTSIPLGCPSPRPDGSCPGHDRGEG